MKQLFDNNKRAYKKLDINRNLLNDLIINDLTTISKAKNIFKDDFISLMNEIIEKTKKKFNRNKNSTNEFDYLYEVFKKDSIYIGFSKNLHKKLHRRLKLKELLVLKVLEDNAIHLDESYFR